MNGYGQLGKDLCKRKGKKSWGYIRNCNWGEIEWDIRPMWLIFTLISIPLSVSRDFFRLKEFIHSACWVFRLSIRTTSFTVYIFDIKMFLLHISLPWSSAVLDYLIVLVGDSINL